MMLIGFLYLAMIVIVMGIVDAKMVKNHKKANRADNFVDFKSAFNSYDNYVYKALMLSFFSMTVSGIILLFNKTWGRILFFVSLVLLLISGIIGADAYRNFENMVIEVGDTGYELFRFEYEPVIVRVRGREIGEGVYEVILDGQEIWGNKDEIIKRLCS